MGVTIKAGQAYVTATPSGQNSQILRVRAAADYTTYVINANASGSTKYDWIYLTISATNANTPSSDASNVASFVTSRSSSNTTDNGSPPTYGILLAIVTVANAASSITNSVIVDKRTQASLSTLGSPSATGWTSLSQVPNTITANGNRSYSLVFNSVDITGTVSAGMRVRTTRINTAPTQCTSLNGTTQYYSKAAPAGMAQTDKITESIWIKPDQYKTAGMISRNNGTTDGWKFYLNSSGQVVLQGARAADDVVTSYQSVPLNKWTHVSASIDTTTTTGVITFDGVTVPSSYTNNANTGFIAPTTAYLIGATNSASPTDFFSGKIAQAASYGVVISVATILTTISQGLAGTETSLISAYSFNNSINDLNANANNLTPNGSAVATATDSPFGGQADGTISSTLDYAEILSTAFSTNTTLVVRVPYGNTIPTSGGVSAVSYSTQDRPYLCPRFENILSYIEIRATQAFTTITQILGLSASVTAPAGRSLKISAYIPASTNASIDTLSYTLWDGVVNSGTQLALWKQLSAIAGNNLTAYLEVVVTPSSTSKTYNLGGAVDTNTTTINASVTAPAWIKVELV